MEIESWYFFVFTNRQWFPNFFFVVLSSVWIGPLTLSVYPESFVVEIQQQIVIARFNPFFFTLFEDGEDAKADVDLLHHIVLEFVHEGSAWLAFHDLLFARVTIFLKHGFFWDFTFLFF